jgi:hypothetical protein
MKQTHCSVYLDRENCKTKHCMIRLQSNAPHIKLTLRPKVGSSRTRWRLFLCESAANRSQKLQCAMMHINGSILLIDGVNLGLHHLSAPGQKAMSPTGQATSAMPPASDVRCYRQVPTNTADAAAGYLAETQAASLAPTSEPSGSSNSSNATTTTASHSLHKKNPASVSTVAGAIWQESQFLNRVHISQLSTIRP